MKTIRVKIQGISPILINRFKEQDELPAKTVKGKRDWGTPREQATATAYVDADTQKLWIPSTWIKGALQTVASDYKLPGSRKSVKSVSGGAVRPCEEKLYFCEGHKLKDIEIDSRPCVVMKARIMRHRSRLETWSVSCTLEIEEDILPVDDVQQMISDAGRRAGMGDFRPQKGGPFGRFIVTEWKIIDEKQTVLPAIPKRRGRPPREAALN